MGTDCGHGYIPLKVGGRGEWERSLWELEHTHDEWMGAVGWGIKGNLAKFIYPEQESCLIYKCTSYLYIVDQNSLQAPGFVYNQGQICVTVLHYQKPICTDKDHLLS